MKIMPQVGWLGLTGLAVALTMSCGDNDPAVRASCANPRTAIVVQVGDSITGANTFSPNARCFRSGSGSTVTFRWGAGVGHHSVTPAPGNAFPAALGTITAGPDGITHVTTTNSMAGVYRYYCINHGSVNGEGLVSGMADSIIIYAEE